MKQQKYNHARPMIVLMHEAPLDIQFAALSFMDTYFDDAINDYCHRPDNAPFIPLVMYSAVAIYNDEFTTFDFTTSVKQESIQMNNDELLENHGINN